MLDSLTRTIGIPPSVPELAIALGEPVSTTVFTLMRLDMHGMVKRLPRKVRGLLITDAGQTYLYGERRA